MVSTEENPIEYFQNLSEIEGQLSSKEAFIFLDYDGTLTPIVDSPDLAVLSDETRALVQQLCLKYKTSIVSGRATDDVKSKVNIDNIFYAGSHGFEIVDPQGNVEINKQAQAFRNQIVEIHQKLNNQLKPVKGSLVEDVKYTISVHYRLVSDEDFNKVKQAVENILNEYEDVRVTSGKKVFELRPKIDWDKGKAVNWILESLNFDPQKNIAIYVGDDTTDEDAFAVIKDKGFGVLVADPCRTSKARYVVKDTEEVKKVLEFLIKA